MCFGRKERLGREERVPPPCRVARRPFLSTFGAMRDGALTILSRHGAVSSKSQRYCGVHLSWNTLFDKLHLSSRAIVQQTEY